MDEEVKYSVCPLNLYFEGDKECNPDKCDFNTDTRACSQACLEAGKMAKDEGKDLSGNPLGVAIVSKSNAAVEKALDIAKDSVKNIDLAIQYAKKMLLISNVLVDVKLTDKKKLNMITELVMRSSDEVHETLGMKQRKKETIGGLSEGSPYLSGGEKT